MTISAERREELTRELDCADQMGDAAGPEIWVFRHELRTLLHDSARLERAEELLERAQPHIGHSGKTNIEERAQEADDLNREVTTFLGGHHDD